MAITASDALLWTVLEMDGLFDWISETLTELEKDDAANSLWRFQSKVRELASAANLSMYYSDGRIAKTSAEIEENFTASHLWEPDPTEDKPISWDGRLSVDPGRPDRGGYVVHVVPPQTVTVTLTPPRHRLQLVEPRPTAEEQSASFDEFVRHLDDGGAPLGAS